MPFTPSHAVVALPFVRTPLIPAAVAVGAMTPDLPLFVRGPWPTYATTHSPQWLPVTMVVALGLLLLWRCVLRPAAPALLPRRIATRLPAEWDAGPKAGLRETFATRAHADRPSWLGTLLVLASLAIGIATHLVWDAFTHEGRWGIALVPALGEQWGPMLGLKWAQHGSSAIGLIVLGVWAARRLATQPVHRGAPPASAGLRWAWWLSLPLLLAAAWAGGLLALGPLSDTFTPAHLAYRVLPIAAAIWASLTVVLASGLVLWRRREARHARVTDPV